MRRDFFLISQKPLVDAFEIAPIVYGPSFISFESALSYHGWISEAVRTITSATVKRSKKFSTPIGIFSYEHVPIEIFPFGVGQHQQNKLTLFIADPVKAIADIIYARKRTWESLEHLCEDLRIERENINNLNRNLLKELIKNYPSVRVKKTLKSLNL